MLLWLLAIGALPNAVSVGPSMGVVTATAEQTAVVRITTGTGSGVGLPISAFAWPLPLDPSDHAPYAYDWSALLSEGETVDEIVSVTMSALGASLGVTIDSDSDHAPMIDIDGQKTGLWFSVADGFQTNSAFAGSGALIGVATRIRTSATPPREYERTAILTVRQQ